MKNYVVISDLHLGEKAHECTFANTANISRFANRLGEIDEVEELILLGDFLEMSLAPISKVTEQMGNFFEGVHEKPKKIVYVPGNHDHHIWALHVEQEIREKMSAGEILNSLPSYVFSEFIGTDSFISGYIPDPSKDKLIVKYPLHRINLANNKRSLLHHGHQIYGVGVRLLSLEEAQKEVSEEKQMEELELQNIGIYELLWFYLEASPRMRRRIEKDWEKHGGFGAFSVVAKEMADSSIANFMLNFGSIFSGPEERGRTIEENKEEIEQYLRLYGKPVECLIYGHSHVPELESAAELDHDMSVKIIGNTGSWVKGKSDNNTYIVINSDGVELWELGKDDKPVKKIAW